MGALDWRSCEWPAGNGVSLCIIIIKGTVVVARVGTGSGYGMSRYRNRVRLHRDLADVCWVVAVGSQHEQYGAKQGQPTVDASYMAS